MKQSTVTLARFVLVFALGAFRAACALASADAGPAPVDQTSAHELSEAALRKASDESIEECTKHAMVAVMRVSDLNFPGAVSSGYRALGSYLTSARMDNTEVRVVAARRSLASYGASGISGAGDPASVRRSIGARDRAFLQRGEAAKIAREFEARTGMSRDTFYTHMASGLDSKMRFSDPDLIDQMEARYEAFKRDISSEPFKEGLRQAEGFLPADGRSLGIAAIKKFFFANLGPKSDEAAKAEMLAVVSAPGFAAPVATAHSEPSRGGSDRAPVAATVPETGARAFANMDSLANGQNPIIGLQGKSSLDEFFGGDAPASLFAIVKRRYQFLAPSLAKRE